MPIQCLSGDQSVLWDAPLKLKVLGDKGYAVTHDVHTADLFSRPPVGVTGTSLTRETYGSDGNVTRWTATMEAPTFLGRMHIHPRELRRHNVDFDLLTRCASIKQRKSVSSDAIIRETTEGDWHGVAHKNPGLVAHDAPIREIAGHFGQLRKRIRTDLRESLGDGSIDRFDNLWDIAKHRHMSWGETAVSHLRHVLEHLGVDGTSVTTSCKVFNKYQNGSPLFELFVTNYDIGRAAYNEAVVAFGKEKLLPLEDGKLPFYALVRLPNGLCRCDLTYEPGDTPERVIARARGRGQVEAVLGKAVTLLLELQMMGSIVIPKLGSSYAPISEHFWELFSQATGSQLTVNPILRLRLRALDALFDIKRTFRLPTYLHRVFGEKFEAKLLGKHWQLVAQAEQRKAEELGQVLGDVEGKCDQLPQLVADGILSQGTFDAYRYWSERRRRCTEAIKRVPSSLEKRRLIARLKQEHEYPLVTHMLSAARDFLAAQISYRIRDSLVIADSLTYWDSRPFSHWVFCVPGWYEAIRKRTQIHTQSERRFAESRVA